MTALNKTEPKQEFSKLCQEKEYGWILVDLNPIENGGLTCKLLVGGKCWSDMKMQEEGYIFTDCDSERVFETAIYHLTKDRPSFPFV